MKRLMITALALGTFLVVQAQSTAPSQAESNKAKVEMQQEEKVKVEASDLPEAVKATLKGADYKDWTIKEAWHTKTPTEHYIIKLTKGSEESKVKLSKEGKKLE
jgi:hypothetical protein